MRQFYWIIGGLPALKRTHTAYSGACRPNLLNYEHILLIAFVHILENDQFRMTSFTVGVRCSNCIMSWNFGQNLYRDIRAIRTNNDDWSGIIVQSSLECLHHVRQININNALHYDYLLPIFNPNQCCAILKSHKSQRSSHSQSISIANRSIKRLKSYVRYGQNPIKSMQEKRMRAQAPSNEKETNKIVENDCLLENH